MEGELTSAKSHSEVCQRQAQRLVHSLILVLSTSSFKWAPKKCFPNASQNSTQMLSVLLTSLLRWVRYVYIGTQRK